MSPAPRKRLPRVLWVEGKDDSAVVQSLCNQHAIPEAFQVVDKESVDKLLAGIPVELRTPGLECFGAVVDANGNPAARWEAIRNLLSAEGYADLPREPASDGIIIAPPEHRPRVGVWLIPDNTSPGMLEDFARALIHEDDEMWRRAVEAVDGIPEDLRRFSPVHRPKALIHTWLAWQEGPGSPMGQAITKGHLDARAPLAERFVSWLRRLMVDDPPPAA